MKKALLLAFATAASLALNAESTIKSYISGLGNDSTVEWDFYCTKGRGSGKWTKIPVPSCWECQGFGQYTYGHMKAEDRLNETGIYRHSFTAPSEWKGKRVRIVFEGVMTDTEVLINGKSAGETHQGGYYEFKYDITRLLKFGKKNSLEVRVNKSSSNESVVHAEREADFWVFGGIFRPVYLEVKPGLNIDSFAIDARADGTLKVSVASEGKADGTKIVASVETLDGKAFGKPFEGTFGADGKAELTSSFPKPELWSAEFPNLYRLNLRLEKNGRSIHEVSERFGFRTVEFRPSDGIYVNGSKIKFKGVDRHSFYPTSGRTLNDRIVLDDVLLIKEMNMNAVRMSHYPPEKRFLEVCDSLGLYVIDELTGWQAAYDTSVGTKLVRELVTRDRNHPSILLWANGNEGGFNFELLGEYPKWDLQNRKVIHPWLEDADVNNYHYPTWDDVKDYLSQGRKVWFPTEFMHGLYDGGHGAGLEDFWNLMWADPLCAGGFVWDLIDQGLVRDDRGGAFDTDGNHGADGILGPYREKEGSFYAIKEIWSPIRLEGGNFLSPSFDGVLTVENRYSFTNLRECCFKAELETIDFISGAKKSIPVEVCVPDVEPGLKGRLRLKLPDCFKGCSVLRLTAAGPDGKEIFSWTRTIRTAEDLSKSLRASEGPKSGADMEGGVLDGIKAEGRLLPLKNVRFTSEPGKDSHLEVTDTEDGWVKVDYAFARKGKFDNVGVTFDFPEKSIKGIRWLGNGPYRVWKNRMAGATFGLWETKANDTMTGENWIYPEFRGYRSDMYAADIDTEFGILRIVFESSDLFLHLLTPSKQQFRNNDNTLGVFPEGQISILNAISPVGTKFNKPSEMGPQSGPNFSEFNKKRRTTHSSGVFYLRFIPKK